MDEKQKKEIRRLMTAVTKNCETCKKYRKTLARPVVGITLSSVYNEVLAMDIGEIEIKNILVMVGMATWCCQAVWIRDKNKSQEL